MTYILVLIFSAISSVCLLISTIAKDKKKLVLWQNFDLEKEPENYGEFCV